MSARIPATAYRRAAIIAAVVSLMVLLPFMGPASAVPPGGNTGTTVNYVVYQLDSSGGEFSCFASNLNDFQTIVGQAVERSTNEFFAAYWDVTVSQDGSVTSHLNLLPQSNGAHATGVNNLDEVIGDGALGMGLYWPSPTFPPLPLPPLVGDSLSLARSINDAGIICGLSIEDEEEHPVVWRVGSDSDGNPAIVGPYALPSVNGIAVDLSEPDTDGIVTVVGNAWDSDSSAAVAWRIELQMDGGLVIDPQLTLIDVGVNASGVNNAGTTCGDSSRPDWIAMLWTESDSIPLALPRRFASSAAIDLNDAEVIVGWVGEDGSGFPRRPVIWDTPDAKPILLSSYLNRKSRFDDLTDASAINESGVIVGAGSDNGVGQAFIAQRR